MKFNIEDYKDKYVMHCKTEEEAKDFCRYLDSVGRKWCSNIKYTEKTMWECYKDETCYNFNIGLVCDKEYYITRKYTILEWSDFMSDNNKFTKADLKSGDVVLRRDGSVEIVCIETGTLIRKDEFNILDELTDDLTNIFKDDDSDDVIAVRRPKQPYECQFCAFDEGFGELVYERGDKPEEMTLEEICKALGKEIKIVKEH